MIKHTKKLKKITITGEGIDDATAAQNLKGLKEWEMNIVR